MAGQIYEGWLAVMTRFRHSKRDGDDDAFQWWTQALQLHKSTNLTGVQVKPLGQNRIVAVSVVARLGSPKRAGRTYAIGGAVTHRHNPGGRSMPYQVEVVFSDQATLAGYKKDRNLVEREIFSILIHEFTHALDFMTEKHKGTHDLAEQNKAEEYHNADVEIRAFTQQIVDEVEDYIRKSVAKDGDTWGLKDNPTSLIKAALDVSFTWQRIHQDLTPKNRRLILRNVGQRAVAQFDELVAEFGDS